MSKYTKAVEQCMDGLTHESVGVCPDCETCAEDFGFCCVHALNAEIESGEVVDDGGFSQSDCDTCGSSLYGARYSAHAVLDSSKDREVIHLSVCVDCMQYIANGDKPESWEG